MDLTQVGVLSLAAFAAGAINGVAGGGTLITFSALLAAGLDPRQANATSTVALWPGTLGAVVAGHADLPAGRPLLLRLALPCFVGGLIGSILLLKTPSTWFEAFIPWLILFATVLFAFQQGVQHVSRRTMPGPLVALFQLGVGIYGGYFGAAIGILTLAALSFLGERHLPRATAVKNVLVALINGVAVVVFGVSGLVQWQTALAMTLASILGGYQGVRLARRLGPRTNRALVVGIGIAVVAWTLWRNLSR
ncbi:MAG TPA: sulfite exporter TauE/SafE family protein [Candidatus Xenobia bacterium]